MLIINYSKCRSVLISNVSVRGVLDHRRRVNAFAKIVDKQDVR